MLKYEFILECEILGGENSCYTLIPMLGGTWNHYIPQKSMKISGLFVNCATDAQIFNF